MKSYSDIEQSKKLAEILPLESADMHSEAIEIDGDMIFVVVCGIGDRTKPNYGSVVWSLAALLEGLPSFMHLNKREGINGIVYWCTDENVATDDYDNPVDACVEMIIKLNELNLL